MDPWIRIILPCGSTSLDLILTEQVLTLFYDLEITRSEILKQMWKFMLLKTMTTGK